jgi:Zn-dependent M28 family amino/carboxypeptidase
MLAGVIGERNLLYRPGALEAAARYVEDTLRAAGLAPAAHEYPAFGRPVRNIEAQITGTKNPDHVWLLGAHYDSVPGTPGADDNASAVAGLLECARLLAASRPRDSVRFVGFVNEEPPFYKGPEMGSFVYARRCRDRNEDIAGMVNLEMIGCFSDDPADQRVPPPFDKPPLRWLIPNRADFIAFCGDMPSLWFTRRCHRLFRKSIRFPSRWVAAPRAVEALSMSDHWSFWEHGYRAVMVTDTAFFRNPRYHDRTDTPDTLNYPAMSRLVLGLAEMLKRLARAT